ncbi:MAG: NADH-quinone oxidoreductase subunit NuoE [Parvularculales bacterium]
MVVRRLDPVQPASFEFTPENKAWAKEQLDKYPKGRESSVVVPLLWRAQKQHRGWLSEPAIRYVAGFLSMSYIRVYEVATFYSMFSLSPVGEYFVQLCGTTPCWLRDTDTLKDACREVIGPERAVSADGKFSWLEVECLGACVNGPVVQINDDYYEDLDGKKLTDILVALRQGQAVEPGPQSGRHSSEPEPEEEKV